MALSKKQTIQRHQILETLYTKGPQSRAELSRILGITPATMTEITGFLLREGVLSEVGEDDKESGVGRKKILLEVSPNLAHYLGVELSDRKLVLALVDNLGNCLDSAVVSEENTSGFVLTERQLIAVIRDFLESHSDVKVKAIGLAVPGHYDPTKDSIQSNNPNWQNFQIERVIEAFDIPVFVKNNVKCMALAKLYFHRGQKPVNFIFLHLKRGMFSAYVSEGQLYADKIYLVGEVGHIVVNPNGELCECGKAGCLQTYASLNSILQKARYIYEADNKSALKLLVDKASDLKLAHIFLAYRLGDELVHQIIEQAIDHLAIQVNNLPMLFAVDAIYIHGKLFEEPLIASKFQAKLHQGYAVGQQKTQIEQVVLEYQETKGAIGACALATRHHLIFGSGD